MREHALRIATAEWSGILYGVLAILVGLCLAATVYMFPQPFLLAIGVVGLYGVAIIVMRIEWGVLFMVFTIYLNLSFVLINYHGAPSVLKLVIPIVFGLVILKLYLNREFPRGLMRAMPFLGLYMIVSIAGLIYARSFSDTLDSLIIYGKDIIIALTLIMVLKRGNFYRQIVVSVLVASIILTVFSVYQYLTETFDNVYYGFAIATLSNIVGETNDYRIGGPFGSPNGYSQVLIVVVPLAFERTLHEKNLLIRILAAASLGLCILAIIFTFSRSAFLGLVVMLVAMNILNPPRIGGVIGYMLIFVLVLQFMPANYWDRISTLSSLLPDSSSLEAQSEVSFRGRSSEGQVAIDMFLDHPILGVGLDNFSLYYQEYSRDIGIDARRVERTAHNRYLEVLAEQGIVGFTAYMLMLLAVFRSINLARRRFRDAGLKEYERMASAFAVSLLGYLIIYFFIDDAHPRYFWLLFGIAFGLPQVARYEIQQKYQHLPPILDREPPRPQIRSLQKMNST